MSVFGIRGPIKFFNSEVGTEFGEMVVLEDGDSCNGVNISFAEFSDEVGHILIEVRAAFVFDVNDKRIDFGFGNRVEDFTN
mgnify:CR=1 FL=1